MSYSQSLNHWKNHRKDRFVQQCSGYFGSQSHRKSLPDVSDTEQRNSHSSMILILKNQRIFPFYIFQDNMGIWQSVPKNHISGHCINSMEELQEFAKEYAEIKEGEIPMIINHPVITESEEFHGFRTVHFYEAECAKAGQTTRRIPGHMADGTPAFALLTLCPTENPASYDGLDILTADEAHCLYSGCIRHDANRELSFQSLGFTPDDIMDCVNPSRIRERIRIPDLDSDPFVRQVVADAKRTDQPEPIPTEHPHADLVQLSLFSI